MAGKLLWPLRKKPEALAVALLMFGAIAFLRVPLLLAMLVFTPVSVALSRKMRR
jgi:chromate transporter